MSLRKFLARVFAVALACIALIALISTLISQPWGGAVSGLLGVVVGWWAYQQIDEYRWLQWFLSVKKVPRSHVPPLMYPFDMKY